MDYVRYLHSKKTVDDRALNCNVLQGFENHVAEGSATNKGTLRVVELGGGVGAMFMRLLERNTIFCKYERVEYTLVDVKRDVLQAAAKEIETQANRTGKADMQKVSCPLDIRAADICGNGNVHLKGTTDHEPVSIETLSIGNIEIIFALGDAIQYLEKRPSYFDAVIAAAVLDLWELEPSLEVIFSAIDQQRSIRAFYFPINFDGTSDFFPESSEGSTVDFQVEDAFHKAMGSRKTLGRTTMACHTGRRLIPVLHRVKADVKVSGGSAWIVSPSAEGYYPDDEKYFLETIMDFIASSITVPDGQSHPFRSDTITRYLSSRRRQIERAELFYVAHNIDVFGTLSSSG